MKVSYEAFSEETKPHGADALKYGLIVERYGRGSKFQDGSRDASVKLKRRCEVICRKEIELNEHSSVKHVPETSCRLKLRKLIAVSLVFSAPGILHLPHKLALLDGCMNISYRAYLTWLTVKYSVYSFLYALVSGLAAMRRLSG